MNRLLLIDAYALVYRAYYAFLNRPMRNSLGLNTSPIFGFLKSIVDARKRFTPSHIAVAFDRSGPTFRTEMYPDYKAQREATPEDIRAAVPVIKQLLEALNIKWLDMSGFEADDIIGSLAKQADCAEFEVIMLSPDKDYAQLLAPNIMIAKPPRAGSDMQLITDKDFCNTHNLHNPMQFVDVLALWGDVADNIKGVPQVGEKTAFKLISRFGNIETLLQHTHELKPALRKNLEQAHQLLQLNRKLVTIRTDLPLNLAYSQLAIAKPQADQAIPLFQNLEFRTLAKDFGIDQIPVSQPVTHQLHVQGSLFDSNPEIAVNTSNTTVYTTSSIKANGSDVNASSTGSSNKTADIASISSNNEPTDAAKPSSTAVYSNMPKETPQNGPSQLITINQLAVNYQVAATPDERRQLIDILQKCDEFAFDTETTSLDTLNADLVGFSVATEPQRAWWVPLPVSRADSQLIINEFRTVFENPNIAKVGQNIKFDMQMLAAYGVTLRGHLFDTMLAHYLLNPDARHNLDLLAQNLLGYQTIKIEELIGRKNAQQLSMRQVPPDKLVPYACQDADIALKLKQKLKPMLDQQKLTTLYSTIEEPLIEVISTMERNGVRIDSNSLNDYGQVLKAQIDTLERDIRNLGDAPHLNVSSPKQLGELLFVKLKIAASAKTTSKSKQFSTSESELMKYVDKHPIVAKILEYRSLKKLLSTYVETLPQLVNARTGRIHASFNQAVASTGRLSSNNPNLQNIPIRDQNGREIRKAFIPADPEHLLLSADYSQIELRIMAHVSGDEHMLRAFRNGEDIHAATAAKIFKVPLNEVTPEQRSRAKTANFGMIYGISAFGLAQRMGISRTEAKELIDSYFQTYQGIQNYMRNSVAVARERGEVQTIFGRRKQLPDIHSSNAVVRGMAERNAINAPIQGSAADIIKLAMISIHRDLQEQHLRSMMIIQVHDELVFDVYKPELEQLTTIVRNGMEHAAQLSVPLVVDIGQGDNWLQAH